ncbi:MAG: carbohydrate ABC transporter permease [Caldilineales bacterium]|nr:carbohydrate ABC transporter permease [Caldilineales bacterium]
MANRKKLTRIILLISLTLLVIVWLTPLGITVMTSMKSTEEYGRTMRWELPTKIALWENIQFAWKTGKLGSSFTRSLTYAGVGAAMAILLSSLAAYSLVQLKIWNAFFWFLLIYAGTIFPFQMYLLPLFYFYQKTHLYDTQTGMLLFYTAIAIPFCLFVLRNHFTTISEEIIEAAKMDGLSNFGIYLRMYMPLSIAPMAALFLFQFTWIWNDLLFGITLAKSPTVRPIMAGLASMRGGYSADNTPAVLAGALLASIPTLLIFILLGRYLLQGMTLTTSGE